MLGSFKSSFKCKNSVCSTSSWESVEEAPRSVSSLFRTPVELSAAALSLNATQPERGRSPLANPSPATRRPGRFSLSPISSNYKTRLTRYATDRPGMNAFTVLSNEPPPAYTHSPMHTSGPTIGPSPLYTAPTQASSSAPSNASL
jgi:hypothetical protein